MKKYKIYGESYELSPTTSEPPDCYAIKGELVDDLPKGKLVGYVTMEDDSVIECYKKFNIWLVLMPILIVLLVCIAGFVYLLFFQPKDVKIFDEYVKVGTDNQVVTYNGFPSVKENAISIRYTNGDYPATILIEGEGIETHTTTVQPGEYVESIPCKATTKEGLVEATITIKTETSTQTFPIVVEVPSNLNANDNQEGLEGYWNGEAVYGAE